MNTSFGTLKNYIVAKKIISGDQFDILAEKAQSSNTSIVDLLIAPDGISEVDMRKAQAELLGVPFVDLSEEKIDLKALEKIPEPVAKKHKIIAFCISDSELHVAVLDTGNLGLFDSIEKTTKMRVVLHIATSNGIQNALENYRKSLGVEFDEIIKKPDSSIQDQLKEATDQLSGTNVSKEASSDELKKIAEDLPIIKIVDTLISHAIFQKASDIHIEPEEDSLIIRYRVDGILHDVMTLPKNVGPGVTVRIKVLADLRLDEKRLPQDGRFKKQVEGQDISFRVSTLPTYFGEKVVVRVLREDSHSLSLEALGFHGIGLEHIHKALGQKTGMILVSGPTGSGKTTTLYTMLDILNTTDVNISTVEDPIEYQVDRINQTQVRSDIGLTFASGLRSLLRQDPDILMVGEIRDTETAELAVNASLTGHLVLSTIHTNSAAGVIPRMTDMGIETFLIASTLRTITAQRLVRTLCESKEQYFLSDSEKAELAKLADLDRILEIMKKEKIVGPEAGWESIPFYKPIPTEDCESGYEGRVGIHEVLNVDDAMRELISGGGTQAQIEEQSKKDGMITMLEDGIIKAVQGITTTQEVLRVISD